MSILIDSAISELRRNTSMTGPHFDQVVTDLVADAWLEGKLAAQEAMLEGRILRTNENPYRLDREANS